MRIEQVLPSGHATLPAMDRSFLGQSELALHLQDGVLGYESVAIATPYRKAYPEPVRQVGTSVGTTFVASDDSNVLGRVDLSRHWTGLAAVDDLAVDTKARRKGVASALLGRAKTWAKQNGLHGVTAETQHNNVAACLLYARAGSGLAGFDSRLYSTSAHLANEIALFWYLMFSETRLNQIRTTPESSR